MRRNTSPRKAPGSPLGAKFRNFRRQVLEMRWDDGSKEGVYSGTIPALGPTSTLSYSGRARAKNGVVSILWAPSTIHVVAAASPPTCD